MNSLCPSAEPQLSLASLLRTEQQWASLYASGIKRSSERSALGGCWKPSRTHRKGRVSLKGSHGRAELALSGLSDRRQNFLEKCRRKGGPKGGETLSLQFWTPAIARHSRGLSGFSRPPPGLLPSPAGPPAPLLGQEPAPGRGRAEGSLRFLRRGKSQVCRPCDVSTRG